MHLLVGFHLDMVDWLVYNANNTEHAVYAFV